MASTAKAAQIAASEGGAAAIGSKAAAEIYGLKTICENIEDIANNITRFLVASPEDAKPTGEDKTALVFGTADRPGALSDVLDVFKTYDINMSNIESRPNKKKPWEYYFFVDILGHKSDTNIKEGLEESRKHCLLLSVLGSFPRATELL